MPTFFAFGYGYSARHVASALRRDETGSWRICGTRTTARGVEEMRADGIEGVRFEGSDPAVDAQLAEALANATHVLVSIAPDRGGDPVLSRADDALRGCERLAWVGYLSTTGVYGDRGGAWVDESTPPDPAVPRNEHRLVAERGWTELCAEIDVPLQIFRLAGIYGPGRSIVERLRTGTARRIVKPGHVFNRIHVDDIAGAVLAGMRNPARTGVFNVADDLPSPAEDPIVFAAEAMGVEPPPRVSIEEAALGPTGLSFYAQSRRVRNRRAKEELGWTLRYPTYREGVTAILAD